MKHIKTSLMTFITFIFASIFIGCQDSTNTIVQNNPTNEVSGTNGGGNNGSGDNPEGTTPGTEGVTIGDDGTITITSRNAIYIGEGSETVDSTTYLVKKYADLTIGDNPYFYTYYKFYYLNNKLRRAAIFYHNVGSDMDYKYTEFVEHTCGQNSALKQIYTYYDNGKLSSYIQDSDSNGTPYHTETYYNQNGVKTTSLTYSNNILNQKTTYYENGKIEYQITYSRNNTESTKYYYTYYASGNKKSFAYYSNGKPYYLYTYFDKNYEVTKLYVYYNSDTTIDRFEYYFDSEYLKYYYTDSGYLYTYLDNKTKTTSTDSSVYFKKEQYTSAQANTKAQSLQN